MYNLEDDNSKKGRLVLSDGRSFCGMLFGYIGETYGSVVFTTIVVGYVESLSDPSYLGQIIALTTPLVGNYGVPSNEKVIHNLYRMNLDWNDTMRALRYMPVVWLSLITALIIRIVQP